jgi:hypothetical protein
MADGVAAPAAGGADCDALNARIGYLQEELAMERAKNEVLLEQVLKAEDGLAEKDVEGYGDVIPNEDRAFWRGQLLENRESAVGILNRMRERAKPAADGKPAAAAAPKPLHNRETAKPAVAVGGPSCGGEDRAAKLRNRAQEIARRDGCSFTAAFRAAEQEMGQ